MLSDLIDKQPLLIAEIGQAHDGSLGILHSFIDAVAAAGVGAVKFQTHVADAESSPQEQFRVPFSYQDTTRFDYWKRMELSLDEWTGIKAHCDQVGLTFISSPFSIAAVDLLETVGCEIYKIGSGEVSNNLLLSRLAETGKNLILSSGMSSMQEIDEAAALLDHYNLELGILQCTTAYPTRPGQWGLNIIQELRDRFSFPVGFSDHSGDIYAGLAAVALGARILEFHVTFDKKMFGPDSVASLTFNQVSQLVEGVRQISESSNSPVDKDRTESFAELRRMFGKSLAVNRDMEVGDIIRKRDLESKKPGQCGVDAKAFRSVLGKKLKVAKKQWDFLNHEDLSDG